MKIITIILFLITNNLISADNMHVMFKFEDLPATLSLKKDMSFKEVRKKVADHFCLTEVQIYKPLTDRLGNKVFNDDHRKISDLDIEWLATTLPLLVTGTKIIERWEY